MRMRGEPLPGLANIERHRSTEAVPQGRVAGGTTAAEGKWPWIASIQNAYSYHLCGGLILNEYWVLTAASCVAGLRTLSLLVVTGTVDWWDLYAPYYSVSRIHVHCNYDKPLYHNDIALLQLSSKSNSRCDNEYNLGGFDELKGGKLTFPDVYARIAFYNDWIRTTMNGCTIA
ncbi:GD19142 [Drosophila simulans]|uniref:GD19142 n=1 Tax=Drosophila simulans TaxID=7240 RepID=B4QVT8_DROSI|nr:GD19142 [Drosophila simulans]